MKNHPIQCIPPNATPTTDRQNNVPTSSFDEQKKVGTFMSPSLKYVSSVVKMEIHLTYRNTQGITKTKVEKMAKVIAIINGIIIVQRINIRTLHRKGRDCQVMDICRHLSEIARGTFVKTLCNL